jgi:hypothetical protein
MRTMTAPAPAAVEGATVLSCSECATGNYESTLRSHQDGTGYACTNPECHNIVHPADFQFDDGEVLTAKDGLLAYYTPEPVGYCRAITAGHPRFAHEQRPTCEDFEAAY